MILMYLRKEKGASRENVTGTKSVRMHIALAKMFYLSCCGNDPGHIKTQQYTSDRDILDIFLISNILLLIKQKHKVLFSSKR